MVDKKWKNFGYELRHHRVAAGLTQDQLAKQVLIAAPTLSALERGTRRPRRDVAAAADATLATGGALAQLWDDLHDEREIPEEWRNYEKAEQQATEIREYQPRVFPGLLQTADYAGRLMRNTGLWDDDQVTALVKARTARLENIGRTRLTFVLDELVLRKVLGSEVIMRAQLDRIVQLARERRAKVLIIPTHSPMHPNPPSPFRVMTLDDSRMIVHEE